MKRVIIILLVAGVVLGTARWMVSNHREAARRAAQEAAWQKKLSADRQAELAQVRNQAPLAPVIPERLPPEQNITAVESVPPPQTPAIKPSAETTVRRQPATSTPRANQTRPGKPPLQDPLAREALSWVGADVDAELYWLAAINDPDLSPKEREDLIEDLNEEGFPDPKNLTLDDLPLILNRIALIEEYAFDAMDEVNAAAFQEAYKDLVNMAARLARQ